MSIAIEKRDVKVETVTFVNPMHNPRLRSEKEGTMACAFAADILINGEHFFLDTAFMFATPDFWAIGDITLVNSFWIYENPVEDSKECQLDSDQQKQILEALAAQMTYDTYSWFTKTVIKQEAA